MDSDLRTKALETLLLKNKDRFLKVTDFRDLLMGLEEFLEVDGNYLRRWINSHFVTMVNQGRLKMVFEEGSNRKLFQLAVNQSNGSDTTSNDPSGKEDLIQSISEIKNELSESQRLSKIYISQMKKYDELSQKYSHLKSYFQSKYHDSHEKSFELLGTITALETTINDYESGLIR